MMFEQYLLDTSREPSKPSEEWRRPSPTPATGLTLCLPRITTRGNACIISNLHKEQVWLGYGVPVVVTASR
jgi:hypothetical protein